MSEVVEAYGYEWEVLDREYEATDGKGILCLMKEPMEEMAFSKNNNNDYAKSDILERLAKFTKELEGKGAEPKIVVLDLTAEDGTGWDKPKLLIKGAFLLTADMYRKYRRYISNKSNWWWLATAYSFSSGYSYYARYVGTEGTLNNYNAFREYLGVAPAYVFSFLPDKTTKQENKGHKGKKPSNVTEVIVNSESEREEDYQAGLQAAWNCAKMIVCSESCGGVPIYKLKEIFGGDGYPSYIFRYISPEEAIERFNRWKQEQEVKVGDEIISDEGNKTIVSAMGSQAGDWCCIDENGVTCVLRAETIKAHSWHKTGRSFTQIIGFLNQVRKGYVNTYYRDTEE